MAKTVKNDFSEAMSDIEFNKQKKKVEKVSKTKEKEKTITFCLKIPEENYHMLHAASLANKEKKGNVTAYINGLIAKDMKKNEKKYNDILNLLNS